MATYPNNATQNGSAFVQLDTYLAQVDQVILPQAAGGPTMPQWALILLGGLLFLAAIPQAVPRRIQR
jgi:hypothetical protein